MKDLLDTFKGLLPQQPSAPGTAPSQDQTQKILDILKVIVGGAGKLGPVNGALGQTIGNLLDGKKSAIGIIGGVITAALQAAAVKALDEEIAPADWIASMENGEVYLSPAAVAKFPGVPRARLEAVVVEAMRGQPGVYLSISKSAVLAGAVPDTIIGRRVSKGVHPARSGDVILILAPQWLSGSKPVDVGTSHGTPFTYDASVPLLMTQFGVKPPTMMMGSLRTADQVIVHFDLVMGGDAAATAKGE